MLSHRDCYRTPAAAGERHAMSGKIQFPDILFEISAFYSERSSFLYKNKTSRPFRIFEPVTSVLLDPEIKSLLSGISLVTEIFLD